MNKQTLKFVLMVMGVIVVTDFVQTKFMKIPVIGKYLPGGGDTPKA